MPLRAPPGEPETLESTNGVHYVSSRQYLIDCIRLGAQIAHDTSWRPDFLIALWPGGVVAGLPVHEAYRYHMRKAGEDHPLDHISLNTSPTRTTYRNQIIGIQYLEDHINADHNVLIIDTTFRAGRLVNDVVIRLKEVLRRNLDHKRIRVASVYYNPEDRSTWTVRPDIRKPHYYLKQVSNEVVYPSSVHRLPDPQRQLRQLNPELWEVMYGDMARD